ncbi:MAG: hypothetical protein NTV32_07100 [Gammaproteobacteria bacterium]|nr:hypothetical protein [Gammaproteobacteria bacterium]
MFRYTVSEDSDGIIHYDTDHIAQELIANSTNPDAMIALRSNKTKMQFEVDHRTKNGGGSRIIFPTFDSDFKDKVLVVPLVVQEFIKLVMLKKATALIYAGLTLKMLDSLIMYTEPGKEPRILARIDKKIEGQDLFDALYDEKIKKNLNLLIAIGRGFLLALQEFQAHELIHRDLKLENVMSSYQEIEGKLTGSVQIIDYSDACFKAGSWDQRSPGTLGYRPQEVICPKKFSGDLTRKKPFYGLYTDIYAAGWMLMALYNLAMFERIYEIVYDIKTEETFDAAWTQFQRRFNREYRSNKTGYQIYETECQLGIEATASENLYKLIMNMTNYNPMARPSIAEVLTRFNAVFPEITPEIAVAAPKEPDLTDSSVSLVDPSPLASPGPGPQSLMESELSPAFASMMLHPEATKMTAQSSSVLAETGGAHSHSM